MEFQLEEHLFNMLLDVHLYCTLTICDLHIGYTHQTITPPDYAPDFSFLYHAIGLQGTLTFSYSTDYPPDFALLYHAIGLQVAFVHRITIPFVVSSPTIETVLISQPNLGCILPSDCPSNSVCASKSCYCIKGFLGPKGVPLVHFMEECQDINECNDNPCQEHFICNNTIGKYTCDCPTGYLYYRRGKRMDCLEPPGNLLGVVKALLPFWDSHIKPPDSAVANYSNSQHPQPFTPDVDECSKSPSPCSHPAICINTAGSFMCDCPAGYLRVEAISGPSCSDIDECSQSPPPCTPPAVCTNTQGNFSCNCPKGYKNTSEKDICEVSGNNVICCYYSVPDIDKCSYSPPPCTAPAVCTNTLGNFSCNCPVGYVTHAQKDNNLTLCEDIDECSQSPPPCTPPAVCTNTQGNFSCNCPKGYKNTSEKDICEDIDECSYSPPPCTAPAVCTNTLGNFSCNCPVGYVTRAQEDNNLTLCEDIDECSQSPPPCTPPAVCTNTQGNFSCNCPKGYKNTSEKDICEDIDKCSYSPPPCTAPAVCTNTLGNFSCNCPVGYVTRAQEDNNLTLCEEINVLNSLLHAPILVLSKSRSARDLGQLPSEQGVMTAVESAHPWSSPSIERNVTNEISQVLNQSLIHLEESEELSTVTFLLKSVETTLITILAQEPVSQRITTPQLEVLTKISNDSCSNTSSVLTLDVMNNAMNVPCSLLPRNTDGALFITYTDLESSFTAVKSGVCDWHHLTEINSQVVTGALTIPNTENLNPPVSFYLNHLKNVDPAHNTFCVFWNQTGWSRRGCQTKVYNSTHTLCSCSHLSSFAILTSLDDFKVKQKEIEDVGLTLLSRIGLIVSVVCLALSLLTFLLCRSLRSAHTSVLTALIGCLFLGQLLFLVGSNQTGNTILCSIIAGGLHFFFLCAFCWMSLESILLFLTVRNLQAMNYLTSRRSHFPSVCVAGFGLPVIIVTISAAIRPREYGTLEHCWLSQNIIWSFLGPILVLILVNTTLLMLTLWLLRVKLASLNTNVSALKDKRLLIFKALAQVFILGCTWILGFFQFAGTFMSYIFVGLNSFQGAFIFLVHCLLNRQVREEYRKVFRRIRSQKSETDVLTASTLPMTVKSSNTYEKSDPATSVPWTTES
ncbi:uncharacterized protein RCH25_018146 [Pelodytes ibericus]